jgi:hypothetical protein
MAPSPARAPQVAPQPGRVISNWDETVLDDICRTGLDTLTQPVVPRSTVVEVFITALSGSSEPPCSFILCGCLYELQKPIGRESLSPNNDAYEAFAHAVFSGKRDRPIDDHGVKDAIFAFLSRPRTKTQLRALLNDMQICACLDQDKSARSLIHLLGKSSYSSITRRQNEPPLRVALHHLFRLVNFDSIIPFHKRQDGGTSWPYTVTHALPHGARGTIRGLSNWMLAGLPLGIFERFYVVFQMHGLVLNVSASTIPGLFPSDNIVEGLTSVLHSALEIWRNRRSHRDDDVYYSLRVLHEAQQLFRTLLKRMTFAEQAEFFRPAALPLLLICDRALTCLNEVRRIGSAEQKALFPMAPVTSSFSGLVHQIYAVIPDVRSAQTHLVNIDRAYAIRIEQLMATPWAQLIVNLDTLNVRPRCGSPRCTVTFADHGSGARFLFCSGCRRIAFCSRACYRAAWAHPSLPHREVCELIRAVCHHAQRQSSRRLPNMDLRIDITPRMEHATEIVNQYITSLRKAHAVLENEKVSTAELSSECVPLIRLPSNNIPLAPCLLLPSSSRSTCEQRMGRNPRKCYKHVFIEAILSGQNLVVHGRFQWLWLAFSIRSRTH